MSAWILFMLQGVEETAIWTNARISATRRLSEHTAHYMCQRMPKIYSLDLVHLIFELPYCRIAKRQTTSQYLIQLTEIDVLEERVVGKE